MTRIDLAVEVEVFGCETAQSGLHEIRPKRGAETWLIGAVVNQPIDHPLSGVGGGSRRHESPRIDCRRLWPARSRRAWRSPRRPPTRRAAASRSSSSTRSRPPSPGANGRRGVMTVECGVDVADAGLHARAAQSTPLLRAAFAEVVRTYAAGLPPGAPPNADYLSMALQRQTDAVLGRPGAQAAAGRHPGQLRRGEGHSRTTFSPARLDAASGAAPRYAGSRSQRRIQERRAAKMHIAHRTALLRQPPASPVAAPPLRPVLTSEVTSRSAPALRPKDFSRVSPPPAPALRARIPIRLLPRSCGRRRDLPTPQPRKALP